MCKLMAIALLLGSMNLLLKENALAQEAKTPPGPEWDYDHSEQNTIFVPLADTQITRDWQHAEESTELTRLTSERRNLVRQERLEYGVPFVKSRQPFEQTIDPAEELAAYTADDSSDERNGLTDAAWLRQLSRLDLRPATRREGTKLNTYLPRVIRSCVREEYAMPTRLFEVQRWEERPVTYYKWLVPREIKLFWHDAADPVPDSVASHVAKLSEEEEVPMPGAWVASHSIKLLKSGEAPGQDQISCHSPRVAYVLSKSAAVLATGAAGLAWRGSTEQRRQVAFATPSRRSASERAIATGVFQHKLAGMARPRQQSITVHQKLQRNVVANNEAIATTWPKKPVSQRHRATADPVPGSD
ncbi:MAG: hypothetical protein HY692_06880 [Cyanobacteria bacterium NC_groundwater_1444_Ag_S-0.65um_54_12]|nr:hypothetical protein [Cyanobacteria bacterium NC_groundwater_1444_Ag_S-0.65um_54_12]